MALLILGGPEYDLEGLGVDGIATVILVWYSPGKTTRKCGTGMAER
jgi:hypothetical protein